MKRTPTIAVYLLLPAVACVSVQAQPVVNCPRAPTPPIIDGNVTLEEWVTAGRMSPFVLLHAAGLPQEETDVRVMYDDEALYVGAVLHETEVDSLRAEVTQNDGEVYRDDCFEFFIDALGTGQDIIHLIVNSIGTRFDEIGQDRLSLVYWDHGVAVRENEWSVELMIPFTPGRPPTEGLEWRVGAARYQTRLNEYSSWNGFVDSFHEPTRLGVLRFGGPPLSFTLADLGEMRIGHNTAVLYADNAGARPGYFKANVRIQGRDRSGHYFNSTKFSSPPGTRTPINAPYQITQDGEGSLLFSVTDEHGQAVYRSATYPFRVPPVAEKLFLVESALADALQAWTTLPKSAVCDQLCAELDTLTDQWRELEAYVRIRTQLTRQQLDELVVALEALRRRVEMTAVRLRAATLGGGEVGAIMALPVDSLTKIFPDQMPVCHASEVCLDVCRNETEAFQIALLSLVDEGAQLSITVSPLTQDRNTIPSECFRIFVVGNVPAVDHLTPGATKRLWPDILAPLDGPAQRIDVQAGETRALWVLLAVPPETEPGEYRGEIVLDSGTTPPTRLPLRVVVHNPVLPSPQDYHLWVSFWQAPERIAQQYSLELWNEPHWSLLRTYLEDMVAHGQKLAVVTRNLFEWRTTSAGQPTFHYTLFDRYVGLCREVGMDEGIEFYSMFDGTGDSLIAWADDTGTMHSETANPGDERFDFWWSAFLTDFAAHLEEKGWLQNVFICPTDEPRDSAGVPTLQRFAHCAELVRAAHPAFKTTAAIDSRESARTLAPFIDRMVFKLRNDVYDRELAAQEREGGGRVEAYICCHPERPNTFITSPNIDTRVIGWLLFRERLTGLLRWSYERWPPDPMSQPEGDGRYPAGDLFIVYPGPEGPYGTPRWEILRDGFEDYELLWMLEEAIAEARARGATEPAEAAHQALQEALTQVVGTGPDLTEFTEDPQELYLARLKVLTTLDWLASQR
ncbi:MAG: glycoside hydrolase domain-containing protein [Candidatus Zipacnadales bacterium]